jgi:hypothetical protein
MDFVNKCNVCGLFEDRRCLRHSRFKLILTPFLQSRSDMVCAAIVLAIDQLSEDIADKWTLSLQPLLIS